MKEEVLAREKLEALKLLLDSTNQVGLQVTTLHTLLYLTDVDAITVIVLFLLFVRCFVVLLFMIYVMIL